MIKNITRPFSLFRNIKTLAIIPIKHLTFSSMNSFTVRKYPVKQQNLGGLNIKNENLKFNADNFEINFYPFYPEVIKKSATIYEINKFSTVVALNFVPTSVQKTPQKSKQNWQNRKSLAFKFNQLSALMAVKSSIQKTWNIQNFRQIKGVDHVKRLIIKNNKQAQKLELTIQQVSINQAKQKQLWKIATRMDYSQFQMLQFLIKESLFDLSGMKLMFDIRRNEELAKMTQKQKSQIEKEDLFKNYDSKDNII